MTEKSLTRICSIDGCENVHSARGWCLKHYMRWRSTGNPLTVKRVFRASLESFWAKVNKTPGLGRDGDCWEWIGGITSKGYGSTRVKNKSWQAHRYSWFLVNGYDTPLQVLHSCDNKKCVNPKHLRAGTAKENSQDAVERGQMQRGERSGKTTLLDAQVTDIKRRYSLNESVRSVATLYEIRYKTAYDIKIGRTWGHITLE